MNPKDRNRLRAELAAVEAQLAAEGKSRRKAVAATFAPSLRRLRTQAGLTLAELAARAGLDRTHLGRIEQGEREPGWAAACVLADALGVSVQAFRDT